MIEPEKSEHFKFKFKYFMFDNIIEVYETVLNNFIHGFACYY